MPSDNRHTTIIHQSGESNLQLLLEGMKSEHITFIVSDIQGRILKNEMLVAESEYQQHAIELPEMITGNIYFITIGCDGFSETKKIFCSR